VSAAPRRIAGLVLAAGGARRFGAPKQLAQLDGRPLLEHALAAMAATPGLTRVAVALGAHADAILAAVDLHGAEPVTVADWAKGQAASLRTGVAALAAETDAIVVALGDQPRVGPETIARVIDAWDGAAPAVRATFAGRPGHPVLLARTLYPEVARLGGDVGARQLLDRRGVIEVVCDEAAVLDVDTPAQLAALSRPASAGSPGPSAARPPRSRASRSAPAP
jgi:CTP:molybdopterin cytidylyltransferase MocA